MQSLPRSQVPPPWVSARRERMTPNGLLRMFEVNAPPVPVDVLCAKLGVELQYVHQPGWDGALTLEEEGAAFIWVDDAVSHTRQRFTIAHELGHLFLHHGELKFRDHITMLGIDPMEREANQFAAELLMPEWLLRTFMTDRTVDELAALFDVSPQAMGIRMQALRRGRSFG
jgi:Zn-dependent peptidase ImmA (M78 family)